jgi:hypothetical protein
MITEKDTIKCEAVFNEERTHRYMWKRVWSKDKPMAAVLMLNPCLSDNIVTDTTTALVVNNIARLERYGGVMIINLFSKLTTKLNFRWNSDEELNGTENDAYIKKAAEECDVTILAWGKGVSTNKRIEKRVDEVMKLIKEHESKLYFITDGDRVGLHPLTPSIRSHWRLQAFQQEISKNEQTAEA